MIQTLCKQRTVSSVILLQQQLWALQEKTAIALFDANNIKLDTAGMMNYSEHVRYQNDPRDELYKTTYSDLRERSSHATCIQMYMDFWVGTILLGGGGGVQKSEKYG